MVCRWVSNRLEYYLGLASAMRTFDPQRFDREVKIPESVWKEAVDMLDSLIYRSNEARYYFFIASALQVLDPKKFDREVKINKSQWEQTVQEADKMKHKITRPEYFLLSYNQLHRVDPERAQKDLPIDKDYWRELNEELGFMLDSWDYKALIVGIAQTIKPEWVHDIKIPHDEWTMMKLELTSMLRQGIPAVEVVSYANSLKSLKVVE